MRKKNLLFLSFAVSVAIVGALHFIAYRRGIELSLILALCLAALIVHPLLLKPLTKLNQRLLDRQKARGRDLDEEEKHEISMGLISLRPVWQAESPQQISLPIKQRLVPWVLLALIVLYLLPMFVQSSAAKWVVVGDIAGIICIFFLQPDRTQNLQKGN